VVEAEAPAAAAVSDSTPTNEPTIADEASEKKADAGLSDTGTALRLVGGSADEDTTKPAARTTSIAMVVPATALFGLH
jgi:hypothetical protein